VEWTVEPTGSEPLRVSVEAWAPKAGQDKKTIKIKESNFLREVLSASKNQKSFISKERRLFDVY